MQKNLKELRSGSELFAEAHLAECAAELIEWQNTGLLRNGKVRELASMCSEWLGKRDSIKVAERMVERAALKAVAQIDLCPKP